MMTLRARTRWATISLLLFLVACNRGYIAIVVDPALEAGVSTALDQYKTDLKTDHYKVIEHTSGFSDPASLRSYLANLYAETHKRLRGVLLIGDLPHAYQLVTSHFLDQIEEEEVISFQYYADLDGAFATSPGYSSSGGHPFSYDLHSGNLDWEIWVGVLPMYKGDHAQTVNALNRYFQKNHSYRTGGYSIPHAYLEVNEFFTATTPAQHTFILSALTNGEFAWTPMSSAPDARIYFDSPVAGLSVDQGYEDLSKGVADFTAAEGHGWWGGHGQIDVPWVEAHGARTVMFWSDGCAVGNLDHPDNFLAAALYSETSTILAAKGTTNDSGGMGKNTDGFVAHNIATSLTNGSSLGEAVLHHVNVPLIAPWAADREFHFGTAVFLGDPTLRLKK